jgi:photosystem II stability/assembly factor-like uncharacterized protein
MNKMKLFFIILSISWSAGMNVIYAQWQWQNPLPQGNTLNGVSFVDVNTGTAVGALGTILRTTNGGSDWVFQASGIKTELFGVSFPDANNGTAVGNLGNIVRTTDGGQTWSSQISGTTNLLNDVCFTDANTGTIVGYNGIILRTTDGGLNWIQQVSGTTDLLTSVSFTDANTGTITGYGGIILRTTDGGLNWTSKVSGTTQWMRNIFFSDTNYGTAVGNSGTIIRTTDGGETWTTQTSGSTQTLFAVSFSDSLNGVVAGNSGTILNTTDGGLTWVTITPPVSTTFWSIAFPNASNGTIVGANGTILKTTDSGINWMLQTLGRSDIIYAVSFSDENHGTAVGAAGLILRTTNAGDTWFEQESGLTSILYDVHFIDPLNGAAVGASGKIIKTSDGGANWIQQTSGTTNVLRGIYFTDANNGTAVGQSGKIIKTTDGGETWVSQTSGTTNYLYGVFFTDANRGTAIGASGTIRRTTNGGLNWNSQTSGVTATLYKIYFVNTDTGYVVGASGNLRQTTNGGQSWSALYSGTTGTIWDINFSGTVNGICTGTSGLVLETTNGIDWISQETGTVNTLYGAAIFPNSATVAGAGGTIMHRRSGSAPISPSNLTAEADTFSISLSWIDNSSDESSFVIERQDGNSKGNLFVAIDTVDANTVTYTDTDLTPNTGYSYRLYAFNGFGSSDYSNTAQAVTFGIAPAAPSNLSASADTFFIILNWVDNSQNETGFRIERKDDSLNIPAPWNLVDSVGADVTVYADTGLTSSTTYSYRIYAYNEFGSSPLSNLIEATTIGVAPLAPGNLAAVADTHYVTLTWDDNSVNETGFRIERKNNSLHIPSPWILIDSLGADATSFIDTGLTAFTTYSYRVSAYNDFGSSLSDSVETTTIIPVELTAFSAYASEGDVKIVWTTATETNNKGFEIERNTGEKWMNTGFVAGKGTTTEQQNYMFTDKVENGFAGKILYRLKQIDYNGTYSYSAVIEIEANFRPAEYSLSQNYPNPFNPATSIKYALPFKSNVKLIIYNLAGEKMTELLSGIQEAGYYEVRWNAKNVSSGIYFYSIQAWDVDGSNQYSQTRKMILIK